MENRKSTAEPNTDVWGIAWATRASEVVSMVQAAWPGVALTRRESSFWGEYWLWRDELSSVVVYTNYNPVDDDYIMPEFASFPVVVCAQGSARAGVTHSDRAHAMGGAYLGAVVR